MLLDTVGRKAALTAKDLHVSCALSWVRTSRLINDPQILSLVSPSLPHLTAQPPPICVKYSCAPKSFLHSLLPLLFSSAYGHVHTLSRPPHWGFFFFSIPLPFNVIVAQRGVCGVFSLWVDHWVSTEKQTDVSEREKTRQRVGDEKGKDKQRARKRVGEGGGGWYELKISTTTFNCSSRWCGLLLLHDMLHYLQCLSAFYWGILIVNERQFTVQWVYFWGTHTYRQGTECRHAPMHLLCITHAYWETIVIRLWRC